MCVCIMLLTGVVNPMTVSDQPEHHAGTKHMPINTQDGFDAKVWRRAEYEAPEEMANEEEVYRFSLVSTSLGPSPTHTHTCAVPILKRIGRRNRDPYPRGGYIHEKMCTTSPGWPRCLVERIV